MSAKYNFSATRYNRLNQIHEQLQVVNCDSFDEARKIVEKALVERNLLEIEELKKLPNGGLLNALTPSPTGINKSSTSNVTGNVAPVPAKPDMTIKYDAEGNVIP